MPSGVGGAASRGAPLSRSIQKLSHAELRHFVHSPLPSSRTDRVEWRRREPLYLPHTLTGNSKVTCRHALAHPFVTRQMDLRIHNHGVHPPALPIAGRVHTGRVFLRCGGATPQLPWSNFSRPFPATPFRALILLRTTSRAAISRETRRHLVSHRDFLIGHGASAEHHPFLCVLNLIFFSGIDGASQRNLNFSEAI